MVNMNNLFMTFLESLKTPQNKALVECIKKGFKTIVENGKVVAENTPMTFDESPVRYDEDGNEISLSGDGLDDEEIVDSEVDPTMDDEEVEPDLVDFINGGQL